ncbi:MAG: hypothetical protein K0S32_1277 [Bacteroidetes bacterium]|jgi:hypothetical protein|nr:hypothetical protein [Bacteroidota bacterium]
MNAIDLFENRKELGEVLGLNEPVSEDVFLCALHNKTYSHNLIMCKGQKGFLDHLLANPPLESIGKHNKSEISNSALLQKGAKALVSWAKTGFSKVSEEMLEKRENACLSCEHMRKPEKFLQSLVTSEVKDEIGKRAANCVCGLCGCSISKKIRLPSESCPAVHPENKNLNLWGESVNKNHHT